MIKIVISGILGTMGKVLNETVTQNSDFELIGGYDKVNDGIIVSDLKKLKKADVIVDFSHPVVLPELMDYAIKHQIPLVLATTGYQPNDFDLILQASKNIPIFYSANYSVGVYLLSKALKLVAEPLSHDYDIEIIEKHHHFKKDHPSGTALKLAGSINDALSDKLKIIEGTSSEKAIHMHALRLGNYVGEHTVIFSSLEETLEFTHIAHDKKVFAVGALKAAKFIVSQRPGLYDMDDLLGGKK